MNTEIKKIAAWSYSRYSTYLQCPLKAKLKFILKMEEPTSKAMSRGTDIHEKAEEYLLHGGALPEELRKFEANFVALKDGGVQCEVEWTFTSDWKPTGWFAPDAWVRVKADAVRYVEHEKSVLIIDFKTGKTNADHARQLHLYSLAASLTYPNAETFISQLWYIDSGKIVEKSYTLEDIQYAAALWEDSTLPMLSDTVFSPKPGFYCRWCHFRKENGGPCEV